MEEDSCARVALLGEKLQLAGGSQGRLKPENTAQLLEKLAGSGW